MDCSCEIDIGHEDGPACFKQKIVTARQTHRCYECIKDIQPGEQYECFSGIWDGHSNVYKTCLDCLSLRDIFFSNWTFTNLWEDFREEMNECEWRVPESCLSKVTPTTRARICELIETYWGDNV